MMQLKVAESLTQINSVTNIAVDILVSCYRNTDAVNFVLSSSNCISETQTEKWEARLGHLTLY